MNNQEILEKAIKKAIEGGWDGEPLANGFGVDDDRRPCIDSHGDIWQYAGDDDWNEVNTQYFIFNHDFARALWGEEYIPHTKVATVTTPECVEYHTVAEAWQVHLQRMVIAEDPIKYLGENI